ncbi:MAG: DNA internalization-related competence protein ComEC/Rec2, partial [Rickettsiella sp.]|nr:DNA internalization-related competence protein ComEC/Rec2 [Rickettsiella sp.]
IGFIFFRHSSYLVTFFIACFLGFSWALIVAHYRMSYALPIVLEGQTLTAIGMVASIPEYRPNQLRFDFLIKKLTTNVPVNYPLRVRLSEYRYHSNKSLQLKKGDIWEFTIRLKRPRGFWCPGSFDYAAALFQQNIQANGYIVKRFPAHLVQVASNYYLIDQLRQSLTYNIKKSLKNYPLVGLIAALTTGIRYDITDAQWQVMRGTGTNHLFAISGLHLAFIASIVYFVTRLFWCRIPYAPLFTPASNVAAVLTSVFAVFYAALSGFALPIQRALLMLLVFLGANLLRRNIVSGTAFYYALLIILAYSPFSVLSASFWLSFMAVALILYNGYGRLKHAKAWQAWGRTQFCVGFGLIPVSLLFFHQVSWISFIANAIAIPSVGFVILPLAFLGGVTTLIIPSFGSILLILAERLLEQLWQLLTYFSALHWAQYTAFIATPWLLVSSMLGLFLLLAPKGFLARYLSVFYLLPLFFWKPDGPKNGEIWFRLLDVGQGLAAVVQTQHHTLVYDTGPSRTFDAGRAVLLPFLQKLGIQKLDMLMVSHGDNDHIGGAFSLLAHMPVVSIVSSIPKKFLPRHANFCHEKMNWQWDEVNFEIIYPASNDVYLGNNSSCVLKISNLKHSILLTGDIEKSGENYLVKNSESQLASTILVVPHHGSKTSSSIEFLNKVRPTIALFPTGYHNQFRFPHSIVLKRYQFLQSTIYDTAIDGTITLKLNSDFNIQVETYRQNYYRFWQG